MWFKNLQIYRLPIPFSVTREELFSALASGKFAACGALEAASRGWVPPAPERDDEEEDALVHAVGKHWLLSLATETRLLPASVVLQETRARARKITLEQGTPPGKKTLRDLKDQVRDEFLPRAFVCRRAMPLWIHAERGFLGVGAASLVKAEEALEHLRKSLPNLSASLTQTRVSPSAAMADWLAAGEAPAGFTLDRECELKAANEERAAVRYVRHPLSDETLPEIRAHLAAGKQPTRLALTWKDRLAFVLTDKGEIKRLEFLDILKEEAAQGADGAAEIFDAELALMGETFLRFLPDLFEALGGEKTGE
ncbi:MAG: recombination-associated protein RdgC [Zoogloeaceae bacterium]|jgi:recombination associated protein RdgC|nr:recombination-associated protein RdgC [Zoogloeaceae bacterium]